MWFNWFILAWNLLAFIFELHNGQYGWATFSGVAVIAWGFIIRYELKQRKEDRKHDKK